jgi:hypothetical protein
MTDSDKHTSLLQYIIGKLLKLLALPTNFRQGLELPAVTNKLAYYKIELEHN